MGIAVVINSNEFKYWFYSDCCGGEEVPYPIRGKVEFAADMIHLRPNGDAHLYDTKWHLVVFQGEICLLADIHMQRYRDGHKLEDDRLLHKLDAFDEKKPVMNRPRKREKYACRTTRDPNVRAHFGYAGGKGSMGAWHLPAEQRWHALPLACSSH